MKWLTSSAFPRLALLIPLLVLLLVRVFHVDPARVGYMFVYYICYVVPILPAAIIASTTTRRLIRIACSVFAGVGLCVLLLVYCEMCRHMLD